MTATKQVVRFGPFKDFIANGVRVGDTITVSGQVSVDAEGNVVGVGDLAAQVKQCYANVKEVLDQFGASMDDIIDEMWLITDMQDAMAHIEPVFQARHEAFGKSPDMTQTMVQVSALVFPELLIEIKVIAKV